MDVPHARNRRLARSSPTKPAATKNTPGHSNWARHGLMPSERGDRGISEGDRNLLFERRDTLAAMGTGGEGAYPGATAGFFSPVGFVYDIEKAMKYYGGMLQAAKIMETATGAPLPYPTSNDTTIEAEIVGEGEQVSSQDVTVSMLMFGSYKLSTKLVKVSLELIQDSAFDLMAFLTECFAVRLGRGLNGYFTNGTGESEPTGILTAATSSGQTVIGDENVTTPDPTTEVGYLDLVRLEHSVDPVYRPGAKFMMHDLTLQSIKERKDKYGRPLWNSGIATGQPTSILGYEYAINNAMPSVTENSPATARKTVLFGRLDKYLIRRVKNLTVLRLSERFAEYGVVGFIGFARYDGNLLDAGTHPVKYLTSPAS